MRLIDADALYETLCHIWDRTDSEDFEKAVFETIINAPTIESEQKMGKWEEDCAGAAICPVCGEYAFETSTHHLCGWFPNYCPNCGARMEVEE